MTKYRKFEEFESSDFLLDRVLPDDVTEIALDAYLTSINKRAPSGARKIN